MEAGHIHPAPPHEEICLAESFAMPSPSKLETKNVKKKVVDSKRFPKEHFHYSLSLHSNYLLGSCCSSSLLRVWAGGTVVLTLEFNSGDLPQVSSGFGEPWVMDHFFHNWGNNKWLWKELDGWFKQSFPWQAAVSFMGFFIPTNFSWYSNPSGTWRAELQRHTQ